MIDLETRLRRAARLLDEVTVSDGDSSDETAVTVAPGSGPQQRWPMVAAAAIVVAAGVGIIALLNSDEDSARSTGSATAPPAAGTTSEEQILTGPAAVPHAPTLDELIGDRSGGDRWALVRAGGATHESPATPYISFGRVGDDGILTGHNGCTPYDADAALAGDQLRIQQPRESQADCFVNENSVVNGDLDVQLIGNDRLVLRRDGDEAPAQEYFRLYEADSPEPVGRWHMTWRESVQLEFREDGEGTIGDCPITWDVTDRLTVSGLPAEPEECTDGETELSLTVFIDLLSQGPVAAVPMGDDTLFIAGDELVYRLTRGEAPMTIVTDPPVTTAPVDTVAPSGEPGVETTAPLDTVAQPDTIPPGVTDPTTPPTEPPTNLEDALSGLGVDLSTAPPGAVQLGDAHFCGVTTWVRPAVSSFQPVRPARCFSERQDSERAVFVLHEIDRSGNQVHVWRSMPGEGVRVDSFDEDTAAWSDDRCDRVRFIAPGRFGGAEFRCAGL
jgi:hypothetical protein